MDISKVVIKRVLVAGGAGFIGSHLVEKLLSMNNQVIVLDNLSSGKLENLPLNPKLNFVKGDIRNTALLNKLIKHSDIVFHLADFIPNTEQYGPGHVIRFSMNNPLLDFDVGVRGTLNILESARRARVKVVFSSSAAVYGKTYKNQVEKTTQINPISPYGLSKLVAEQYCNLYHKIYDLPVIIVRLFNIYGPRQRKYVMYDILSKLRRNPNVLRMLGTGEEQRDFVFVKDAVDALVYLSSKEEAYGQTFDLGTGISTSIRQVVNILTTIIGAEPIVEYSGRSWNGDIEKLVADPAKLKKIGFFPTYSLEKGLKELIRWYEQNEKVNTC